MGLPPGGSGTGSAARIRMGKVAADGEGAGLRQVSPGALGVDGSDVGVRVVHMGFPCKV